MSHKTLMILGMHRSGTSLLASWLASCGLHLGTTLAGAHIGNTKGHFEDMDFIHLHDKLLRFVEISDGGLTNIKNVHTLQENLVNDEIRDFLNAKNNNDYWGWKDPRTCLFLKSYNMLIPNAKAIVIFRKPLEVVDSIIRREEKKLARRTLNRGPIKKHYYQLRYFLATKYLRHFKAKQFLLAWLTYNELLIEFLEKKNVNDYILLNLNDLEKSEKEVFNKLTHWGFPLSYHPLANVIEKSLLLNTTAKINQANIIKANITLAKLESMANNSKLIKVR